MSSALVALSTNIIYSAFSLLFAFVGVGLIYAMLSADFLAVAQLMLYVGGILVLILFAVMLTSRIGESKRSNLSSSRWLALLVAAGLFCIHREHRGDQRRVYGRQQPAAVRDCRTLCQFQPGLNERSAP